MRVAARPARFLAALPTAAEAADAATDEEEIGTREVAALLTTLTQPDMEIAELSLRMGDLQLRVRRSVEASGPAAAAAAAAPAPPAASMVVPVVPEPMLQPALHLAPAPYVSMDEPGPEESIDESMIYVTANRVGTFRKGKSKCKVGDQVKRGQILGAIEQLGTMVDVKAPQGGEVVSFKVADGDPVEYGGPLVLLAPFFGVEEAGVTTYRGV